MPDSAESSTRERLIEAAAAVFVEQGFREATVREICGRAGANIASVNYHFRDKEGLYRAVLEWAAGQSFAAFSDRAAAFSTGAAADRLSAFIRNIAERMLPEGKHTTISKLMAREMVEPTNALRELVPRFLRPQHDVLRGIVSELLGRSREDRAVCLCCNSIMGQMLFYKHARAVIAELTPEQTYGVDAIDEIVRHVTAFSLGAIAGLRANGGGS